MEKKNKISKIILPIALALMGGGVGFMAARLGLNMSATIPSSTFIALVFLSVPAFFIAIAFHEGGHALAGIYMDFDFRLFVVGPFLWDKEQTGWKFKWNRNLNISGGLVICLPKGGEHLSKRFSVYAIGGPMASLMLTGIAFATHKLLLPIGSSGVPITLSYFFGMLAFLSLMIFLVTIMPLHAGGFSSDGARVLRFLGGGDKARFEQLLLNIISSSTSGIRPKFMNPLDIEEAMKLSTKLNAPMGVYLHAFAHQLAFDNGTLDLAEKHLLDYVALADEVPQGMRAAVWMDAAFFYAYAKEDLPKATEYWAKFTPSAILPKAQIFATEAVLASLKNDKKGTHAKIEAALKELPNMIDKGLAVALKERLELISDSHQVD